MNDLVLTDRAALALIDEAERALAAVDNPEDADDLWRRVKAVEEAARLARVSEATLVTFRRVQLRAKRRYGELLGPAENRGPATVTASDGSTSRERESRSRARKLAAVPEPVFNAHLEQSDPDKLSEAGVIREARRNFLTRDEWSPRSDRAHRICSSTGPMTPSGNGGVSRRLQVATVVARRPDARAFFGFRAAFRRAASFLLPAHS